MRKMIAVGFCLLLSAACGQGNSPGSGGTDNSPSNDPPKSTSSNSATTGNDETTGDELNDFETQYGKALVQLLVAIQFRYKFGLNEKSLIAELNSPINADKLKDYWKALAKTWWNEQLPPCRDFSTWGQLAEDRFWVKVAESISADMEDEFVGELLGIGRSEVLDLREGRKFDEPRSPRRINLLGFEDHKHFFQGLFQRYGLNASFDPGIKLKQKIIEETQTKLINAPTGLRRKALKLYRDEFVQLLNYTTVGTGPVAMILLRVAENSLPGFGSVDLQIISPAPTGTKLSIKNSARSAETSDGIRIDPGAKVQDEPVIGFELKLSNDGDEVRVYTRRGGKK